jgi:3-hydroxyacyl-[acyl-carrier-protein] dehydratase
MLTWRNWLPNGARVNDGGALPRRDIDLAAIVASLPHRGDALFPARCWLDSAEQGVIVGGGAAQWSADHPVLLGHFPGFAIVPGVFLIEAAAQITGVLIRAVRNEESAGDRIGVLSSVKKALIHAPVMPGQQVDYQLKLRPAGEFFYQVSGVGTTDGNKAISLELTIGVFDRTQLSKTNHGI